MKAKRATIDPMITMINVVFLLIAFFLFGQFEKPTPISVALPVSTTSASETAAEPIYIDDKGVVYFEEFTGEEAIKFATAKGVEIQIHADENASVNDVIRIWKTLLAADITVNDMGVQK